MVDDWGWASCPSLDEVLRMAEEGEYTATDGCPVEADGICEHGCKSWLLELGMI